MATMPNPWLNDAEIADEPTPFQINEEVFWHAIDPTWSWGFEDDPPLFLTDPSPDFIDACHLDLLPLLERAARMT